MSDPLFDELPILRELEADLRAAFRAADSRRAPHRRLPTRRRRWSLAAATAALAAIAAASVFALEGGGVTPTIAAAVLRRAADVAQRQPAPFPRDDQFYYLRSLSSYRRPVSAKWSSGGSTTAPEVRLRVEQQLWFSAGRTGLTRSRVLSLRFATSAARRAWERAGRPSYSTSPQRIATLGANRYLLGDLELSRRQVLTFTTDPPKLYQRLYAAGGSAYEVFVEIGDQLRNRPTPAPLRAALYRALALVPGIRLVGAITDSIGRHGQAAAFTDHGVEDELIFDPKTATMLEERTIAAARNPLQLAGGTTISSTTYIQRAITDKITAP
jgi:hypothetical protein